jgi:homoserine kinase
MNKRVSAFAPASIGNVSVGFDCLGLALEKPGDIVSIEPGDNPGVELIDIQGDNGALPKSTDENVVGVVIKTMMDALDRKDALAVRLVKGLPLQSGLGSSASSSVAAAVAANAYLGQPFTKEQLIPFAMEGERLACGAAHADNVAPAMLGGITLIRSNDPLDIISLPFPNNLYLAVVHPQVGVATREARAVIPESIPRAIAVSQSAHLASFISGLYQKDWDLLARSMVDLIAEPHRKNLLPHFDRVKDAAMTAGALTCGISGSGPTMFALCRGKASAEIVAEAMGKVFSDKLIDNEIYVSKVNSKGAELI